MGTLRRLLTLAPVPVGRASLAVGLGALAVAFGVGLMTTAGYLVTRAAEQPAILSLTTAIVAVRFFGLARPLARYLERLASHDVALRVLGRIRAHFYSRIEPLAPAELEAYRRGDLLDRMVGDVDALQALYLPGLAAPLVAGLVGGACLGVAAAILPLASVALAAGLALGAVAVPLVSARLARHAARRQAAARGALTAELVELLRGAPELVVNGRDAENTARIRDADRELVQLGRRDALAAGVADALGILVAGVTTLAVLALAVRAHDTGALDRVLIAALALLALASFEAVAPLPPAARGVASALTSGRRVLDLAGREPSVCDPPAPRALAPGRAAVALEDVTARYRPDEPPVLAGLDLRIDPGRRVALVGPSGSGKTTVVNMLLRFLDPEEGRVTIGGHDIRELRQEDVRRTFAVAGQDGHLFDSSIRENLRLARPTASDRELHEALRLARLDDWVSSLPGRLDTLVGEEGAELSGGQRQRLVLARALLADASVLVLDEPTAHLDPETAGYLMSDVLDAAGSRSLLLVTHRDEGLDRMDEIVSLKAAVR